MLLNLSQCLIFLGRVNNFILGAGTGGDELTSLCLRGQMFRTMLVEGSSLLREIVKYHLQDQFPSMDIIEAADGTEAFQKINGHPPNLIFMDIGLPGESGLELTRRIKADYPGVIIIILTSHGSSEYREAADRSEADYFFSKGAISNNGIFTLVKSILLTKGFHADGSEKG